MKRKVAQYLLKSTTAQEVEYSIIGDNQPAFSAQITYKCIGKVDARDPDGLSIYQDAIESKKLADVLQQENNVIRVYRPITVEEFNATESDRRFLYDVECNVIIGDDYVVRPIGMDLPIKKRKLETAPTPRDIASSAAENSIREDLERIVRADLDSEKKSARMEAVRRRREKAGPPSKATMAKIRSMTSPVKKPSSIPSPTIVDLTQQDLNSEPDEEEEEEEEKEEESEDEESDGENSQEF